MILFILLVQPVMDEAAQLPFWVRITLVPQAIALTALIIWLDHLWHRGK